MQLARNLETNSKKGTFSNMMKHSCEIEDALVLSKMKIFSHEGLDFLALNKHNYSKNSVPGNARRLAL